jgi:hypothetical protein
VDSPRVRYAARPSLSQAIKRAKKLNLMTLGAGVGWGLANYFTPFLHLPMEGIAQATLFFNLPKTCVDNSNNGEAMNNQL